jgi:UDP-N-acetylmuramyl pentapeptide phosphotransferase/UDP-N-acetylglucosamine-1-phosphate transferase
MLSYLPGIAALTLTVSIALVRQTRRWARSRLVLDHPNDRSLHHHPTPRGGGLGIVIPVCLALAGSVALVPSSRATAASLLAAGMLVAAVGLVDDVRRLPALTRLAAHVSAAVVVVLGVGTWSTLTWPSLGSLDLAWAAVPFTVVWIVGLTNAYNFMDGIDGIAGAQGLAAGAGWTGLGLMTGEPLLFVVGAVTAPASLGFLFFNWSPSSIFMGDVGSSFLGFLFAALAVSVSSSSPEVGTAAALFVWPFVFDSGFTLLRRARRRENLLRAHRSHLYQRLVLTGMSHHTVAILYGALAGVGVAVGMAVAWGAGVAAVVGAGVICSLAAALWATVFTRERAARVGVVTSANGA